MYDLLKIFSVDKWYNAVQKELALSTYPPETTNILSTDIFLFDLKDQEFLDKHLPEATTSW